jgi:hypothetical protein
LRNRATQLALASDPLAPPERLEQLATSKRRSIQQAVASNPNTPLETLLELLPGFSEAVVTNPVFPLLLLERPGLLDAAAVPALRALCQCTSTPPALLASMASSCMASLRGCVAKNPSAPAAALRALSVDAEPRVREAAAGNPSLDRSWLALLIRSGAGSNLNERKPPEHDLPSDVLTSLLTAGPFGRELIARHPAVPASLLEVLAADDSIAVREALALNEAVPVAIVASLALKQLAAILAMAAGEPPDAGSLGTNSRVRAAFERSLFAAPSVPLGPNAMAMLRDDRSPAKLHLAGLPSPPPALAPAPVLRALLVDDAPLVRLALTTNGSCPPQGFALLMKDADPAVRSSAKTFWSGINMRTRHKLRHPTRSRQLKSFIES